ncbi:MAG: SUMF1/EgtB/PvdO family nonheme iron enzyme, partial [Pseudomonadota bacterium]
PIVARRLGAGRGIGFGSWLSRQPRFLRIPILIIAWPVGWSLWIIWRTPSFVLSVIDWMLVRIVAVIAGTTLRPFPVRYAVLFLWLGVSIYFAWTGPYGILAAFAGVVVVLSVVRRWSWIESDREAFQTMREYDHQTKRVGFGEDLRDEALTAIVFVFILIPLALRQTDLVYGAFYHADGTPIVLDWIGFFGAELAKSVPFVDWSEVFHVANGSPIKPKTPLGAQLVFALRAALDLLLLAAILQAVQIAARLREQDKAFWAGKLPIVDPFAERAYFSRVEKSRVTHPHVPAAKQPAAIGFPEYQERRLCQIVEGEALSASSAVEAPVLRDSVARQGAMTILARQSPDEKTARLIAAQSVNPASGNDLSAFCVQLAVESAPDHAGAILAPLLAEAEAPAIRAQIARELGRLEVAEAFDALSQRLFASDEDITVRAAAAVALSKLSRAEGDPSDILSKIDELAIHLQADTPDIVLMLSYARAGWPPQQEDAQQTVSVFPDKLRPLALRAARSRLEQLDQMVEISAGHYMMGAAEGETGALARKYPQHEVKIAAFEMGKYAVTFEEYDAFCEATDREK